MEMRFLLIVVSIVLVVFIWLIDAIVDGAMLGGDLTQYLFAKVPPNELVIRLVGSAGILFFGFFSSFLVQRDKNREKKLKNERATSHIVFTESFDGIALVNMETGEFLTCNPEFQAQVGRSMQELSTTKVWEIRSPEKAQQAKLFFQNVKAFGEVFSSDETIERADGKTVFVEIKSKVVEIGGESYILSQTRDIGKRKLAELSEVKLRKQLEETTLETITLLAKTVDEKDAYTAGHCQRLAQLTTMLGKEMRLEEGRLEQLRYAALLHDVGKIGVPDHILQSPESLSEEEFSLIKKHPTIGADLVSNIHFLKEASVIIFQHHEHFDGKGYPSHLKGEDILLESRILSVADAYDAMRSDRPYRSAMSHEEALQEIKFCSGKQFDPAVVAVFKNCISSFLDEYDQFN